MKKQRTSGMPAFVEDVLVHGPGAQDAKQRMPYATLLPYQIKFYPVLQVSEESPPVRPEHFPPDAEASFVAWRTATDCAQSTGNQIYLHVPFCDFVCDFCPLYKTTDPAHRHADVRERFVDFLCQEIEMYGGNPALADQVFNTVYFGGGTPSFLKPEQLARILNQLRQHLVVSDDAEITLEGVAKHLLAPGYLDACHKAGFNRISFGVQSLDPDIRKAIGRPERPDAYSKLVAHARAISPDFRSNVDLLIGLPTQTLDSLERDLAEVIAWRPSSIDVLNYVMLPETRLFGRIMNREVDAPNYGTNLLQMRRLAASRLVEAGYSQISGETFVLDADDRFVTTALGGGGNALNTILALGPSSWGHFGGTIYANVADLDRYCDIVASGRLPITKQHRLSGEDARRRAVMLNLFLLRVPVNVVTSPLDRLRFLRWQRAGLVERVAGHYQVTERGTLWYNMMQGDMLPVQEKIKLLPLMGTGAQLVEIFLTGFDGLTAEHAASLRSGSDVAGYLQAAFMKGYLKFLQSPLSARFPWRGDARAVAWRGSRVDEEQTWGRQSKSDRTRRVHLRQAGTAGPVQHRPNSARPGRDGSGVGE